MVQRGALSHRRASASTEARRTRRGGSSIPLADIRAGRTLLCHRHGPGIGMSPASGSVLLRGCVTGAGDPAGIGQNGPPLCGRPTYAGDRQPRQIFRPAGGGRRGVVFRAPRTGIGVPRPQRSRQVDDDEEWIAGFLAPTSGTAEICGHDIRDRPVAAKRCLGYLPGRARRPIRRHDAAAEDIDFVAHIRGFSGKRGAAAGRAARSR